jgi:hypothetical protein
MRRHRICAAIGGSILSSCTFLTDTSGFARLRGSLLGRGPAALDRFAHELDLVL